MAGNMSPFPPHPIIDLSTSSPSAKDIDVSASASAPDPDYFVSQVIEIIPDVDPEHVSRLVLVHLPQHGADVVPVILHRLFEDSSYPKKDLKGKRKIEASSSDDIPPHRRTKIDYSSPHRAMPTNPLYWEHAMNLLQDAFPYIPKAHVRKRFQEHNCLFAPTYLFLTQEAQLAVPPYNPKRIPFRLPLAFKGKANFVPELEEEREYIRDHEERERIKKDAAVALQLNTDEYDNNDAGIECGCCFDKRPFEDMIQCNEGHLFCKECMCGFAETKLGGRDANITCMDQGGCKEPFPISELKRFLSDKLMALYESIKQRKEIEAAGLDDLEECPFCDYKCVIDNPDEKLFRCGNEDGCGAVSCRKCKKPDHLPKSCQEEMDEEKKLNGLHHIEEAMTEALMRKCPRCQQAFIKETGCNKMACPNCKALSCYNCRQLIKGYDHFDQTNHNVPGPSSSNSKKCKLWEPVEERHHEEVKAAAERARETYRRENPDVRDANLDVQLPEAAARLPQPPPAVPPMFGFNRFHDGFGFGPPFPIHGDDPVFHGGMLPRFGLGPPPHFQPPVPVPPPRARGRRHRR